MISIPLVIFVLTVGFLWWLMQEEKEDGKYKKIPGPRGIPVLGNVLQVGKAMHIAFTKWADEYGKIFKIKLGSRTAIIVSDPNWCKELLSMEFMTGRQFFEGFELYPNEPLGIASIEGEFWEVHRKFLIRGLRDFGFAKSSMEEKIIEEVKEVIERIKASEGSSMTEIKKVVLVAVVNTLWTIAGSKRFAQDDPKVIELQTDVNNLIDKATKHAITFFVPWTRHFVPKMDMTMQRIKAEDFYGGIIKDHENTLQEDNPRDFVDMYLIEMKANKDNPKSQFYGDKARRQLLVELGDIMFAGTDTTSMTMQWSVLLLTWFKNVQEKFQEEIKRVTSNSRLVSISDRAKMPYALATIDEIFRYSSLAATGVQRRAKEGKEFKGYFIPENAWVFPNLFHIHHSKDLWGDPENFRPERFLSDDGKSYIKSENLMPFQTGNRRCIGEPMARETIFLFLTNIFQRFTTQFDPTKPEPTLKHKVTQLFAGPPDYHVMFKDRQVQ